jgi:hypothetical protein
VNDESTVQIRSFRNCFKLERRIHKIDRWRVPLPFGVPLRSIGYALGAMLTMVILGRVPVLGIAIGSMNPVLRFGVLPIASAYALTCWEIDGRPAHALLRSWTAMRLRPTRVVAWRGAPAPGPVTLASVTLAPDDRSARLRPAVIDGPARVLIRYPFRAHQRGRTLTIEPEAGPPRWRGSEVAVGRGQRLKIL